MAESKQEKIDKLELEMKQITRTESLLNQNQVQKLFNSTPNKFKYARPAKGGGEWTYVKTSYVRKVLDSVFGFAWSFDIETSVAEAFEVAKLTGGIVVKGTLRAKVYKDKEWVVLEKTQFGRSEVKWQMTGATDDNGRVIYETDSNGKRKVKKVRKIDPFSNSPMPLDIGNDFKAASSDCLKKCASLFGIAADVYEAGEFEEINIKEADDNSAKKKATDTKIKEAKKAMAKEADVVPDKEAK